MAQVPSPEGVNVAVYTVDDEDEKAESAPFVTETSSEVKFVVASLAVKVKEIEPSFEVSPLMTSAAVITSP